MQAVSLQPSSNTYPLVDDRWMLTRVVHQVIFLFDYFFFKIREWCSCLFGAPVAAYQHCPVGEFRSLGGRVDEIRRFNMDTSKVENGGPVVIPRDANVYPVCVAGRNRSQITKIVLQEKGVQAQRMNKAHGALLAMDVLDEYDDHEMVTFFGTIRMNCCQESLGKYGVLKRTSRIGEEETCDMDKFQRRRWMDDNYFLRIIQARSVVITYRESFAPIVARLVEVAQRNGLGLQNVHIIPIDSVDPVQSFCVSEFVNCLEQLFSVR